MPLVPGEALGIDKVKDHIGYIAQGEQNMRYNILSVSEDAKTIKGEKKGFLTGILYLAPGSLSGKNLCPYSSPECRALCLNKSGLGRIYPHIQEARIAKAKRFNKNPKAFVRSLMLEIAALKVDASKKNLVPCVRLNGTSDILWEEIMIDGHNIFQHFPEVQFYDYHAHPGRVSREKNYHLTFSLKENNAVAAYKMLGLGQNVTVVFNVFRTKPLPSYFNFKGMILPVLNGDESDLRFLDPKGGYIIGLHAKGVAYSPNGKASKFGFVQAPDYDLAPSVAQSA